MTPAALRLGLAILNTLALQSLEGACVTPAVRTGKPAFRMAAALLLALPLAIAGRADAQTAPGNGGNFAIPGPAQAPGSAGGKASPGQTCVQVQIQGQKPNPYDCLNQQLQQQVQGESQNSPSLPLSAASPSNKVGTFNEQGLKEQYGPNFGKSVIPYRPPAPTFSSGLHP